MSITVYSKPACVQCKATMRHLDSKGINYNVVDLSKDDQAMEQVKSMGYLQAPVVIAGDSHWAGYQPDRIDSINLQVQVA